MKFNTKSVHSGRSPCPATGAISTPIWQTSTFVFDDFKKPKEHDYSRTSNPTRSVLENALADLDGGTYRLFSEIMTKFGLEFTFIRLDDAEKIKNAIKPNTKMIWIETPSN